MIQALYIGRFQPFHNGHAHCLKYVLSHEPRLYIMVGSSNKSGTDDNPFTTDERMEMVKSFLNEHDFSERCIVKPVPDFDTNDDGWFEMVTRTFPGVKRLYSNNPRTRKIFRARGFDVLPIPFLDREKLSGTFIRSKPKNQLHNLVPEYSRKIIDRVLP